MTAGLLLESYIYSRQGHAYHRFLVSCTIINLTSEWTHQPQCVFKIIKLTYESELIDEFQTVNS